MRYIEPYNKRLNIVLPERIYKMLLRQWEAEKASDPSRRLTLSDVVRRALIEYFNRYSEKGAKTNGGS